MNTEMSEEAEVPDAFANCNCSASMKLKEKLEEIATLKKTLKSVQNIASKRGKVIFNLRQQAAQSSPVIMQEELSDGDDAKVEDDEQPISKQLLHILKKQMFSVIR